MVKLYRNKDLYIIMFLSVWLYKDYHNNRSANNCRRKNADTENYTDWFNAKSKHATAMMWLIGRGEVRHVDSATLGQSPDVNEPTNELTNKHADRNTSSQR